MWATCLHTFGSHAYMRILDVRGLQFKQVLLMNNWLIEILLHIPQSLHFPSRCLNRRGNVVAVFLSTTNCPSMLSSFEMETLSRPISNSLHGDNANILSLQFQIIRILQARDRVCSSVHAARKRQRIRILLLQHMTTYFRYSIYFLQSALNV